MAADPGGGPVRLGLVLRFTEDYSNLEKKFEGIIDRSRDFQPWFEEVFIPTFHEVEHQHFASEGAYLGAASLWAEPYSPDYADFKEQTVHHLVKEVFSDQLIESLTGFSDGTIEEVGPTAARIGTHVESEEGYGYAQVQQGGAPTVLGRTYNRSKKDGSKGAGSRKKRPSESGETKKAFIPPRPVVLGSWPESVRNETADSIVKYLVYGEIEPVVTF